MRRRITLLRKMSLSYFFIIALMATVLGVTLYRVSAGHYQQETRKLNRALLRQSAEAISDRILTPVNAILVNFYVNTNHTVDLDELCAPEYPLGRLVTLRNELTRIVTLPEGLLEGVHVYIRDNKFVISSAMGYKRDIAVNRRLWPDMGWFTLADEADAGAKIILQRTLRYSKQSEPVTVVTFVSPYPAMQTVQQSSALIALDVRVSYVTEVLDVLASEEAGFLYLFDASGNLIAHSGAQSAPASAYEMGYSSLDAYVAAIGEGSEGEMNERRYMRMCSTLSGGWVLASYVPVESFYAVRSTISLYALGITLATAILSLFIAQRFAHSLYAPISRVVARTRSSIARIEGDGLKQDEFEMINGALDEMGEKLAHLTRDWEDNLPTLKQSFMHGLTEGEPMSEQRFSRQLSYYAREIPGARYAAMLIALSPDEDAADSQDRVNAALIKYIERSSDEEATFIACEKSVRTLCALIVARGEAPASRFTGIAAYARHALKCEAVIAVGRLAESPALCRASYDSAVENMNRAFFEPWNNLFLDSARDLSPQALEESAERLEEDLKQFSLLIGAGDADAMRAQLQICMERVSGAPLPCAQKHALLARYAASLGAYAGENASAHEVRYPNEGVTNISEFETWLYQACLLASAPRPADSRAKEAVDNVKRYIDQNLSQELSLTRLSEYTTLSNSYLSRIFKEYAGVNLVDYVTERRMAEAARMLTDTILTVEQIARALGYNTPHYFSKRFREHFGISPMQFRSDPARRGNGERITCEIERNSPEKRADSD